MVTDDKAETLLTFKVQSRHPTCPTNGDVQINPLSEDNEDPQLGDFSRELDSEKLTIAETNAHQIKLRLGLEFDRRFTFASGPMDGAREMTSNELHTYTSILNRSEKIKDVYGLSKQGYVNGLFAHLIDHVVETRGQYGL